MTDFGDEQNLLGDSNQDTNPAGSSTENRSNTIREIYRVGIKAPPFFKEEPDLYFIQMEAQFRNASITNENTKFDHVIAQLEPKYLQMVSDVVRNPPPQNKYTTLKERLIKEFTDSDQRKLRRLMNECVLGNNKPSQLLKKMKDLASGSMTDDALKSLWIQHLPENVRAVISIAEGDSTQWAKQADKIMEISSFANIAVVENPIQAEIAALRKQIEQLKSDRQSRDTEKSNGNHKRDRSQKSEYPFCRYHY